MGCGQWVGGWWGKLDGIRYGCGDWPWRGAARDGSAHGARSQGRGLGRPDGRHQAPLSIIGVDMQAPVHTQATAARAMRVYHVAHALLAAAPAAGSDAAAAAPSSSGPSKALESYALFSRAQQRAAEAAESLKGLAGGDAAAGVLLKGREALLAELAELGRQAAAYKWVWGGVWGRVWRWGWSGWGR